MTAKVEPSDLDRLNDLAPSWIRVTRMSHPNPADDKTTMYSYSIIDESAGTICTLSHTCKKDVEGFVVATLAAIENFGLNIVELPEHLMVEFNKLEEGLEKVWRVFLIDVAQGRCVFETAHTNAVLAVAAFWEHPVLAKVATIAAQAAPALEPGLA